MNTSEYYNSQRKPLVLPEYGRHIHEMVNYIKTVESSEDRNRMAKSLINIMANLTPGMRDNPEFKNKLWNHLAQMANYELDVEYPCPITLKEDFQKPPNKLPYPSNRIKQKHYGGIAQSCLRKFKEMPDSESKTVLLEMLANHMKKLYLLWNKEAVSDEQIFTDMAEMAGDVSLIDTSIRLNETRDILFRNQKPKIQKSYKKNNRKQRQ